MRIKCYSNCSDCCEHHCKQDEHAADQFFLFKDKQESDRDKDQCVYEKPDNHIMKDLIENLMKTVSSFLIRYATDKPGKE